jgi:hypothetical protein
MDSVKPNQRRCKAELVPVVINGQAVALVSENASSETIELIKEIWDKDLISYDCQQSTLNDLLK